MLGFDKRILKPSEFDGIRKQPKKFESKFILDLLLNTGMRYSELHRFVDNLTGETKDSFEWFNPDEDTIILPKKATKTKVQRDITLTHTFTEKLVDYMEHTDGKLHLPTIPVLDDNLKRWGIKANIDKPTVIAVKTFRKTLESWLVFAEKNVFYILSSQGHSDAVALKHYISRVNKWNDWEKEEIIKRTRDWGE